MLIGRRPPESPRWVVKISDFGISKRMDYAISILSSTKGTKPYMAPEVQMHEPNGDEQIDYKAADMWSLGEMTSRMLVKAPTFPTHAALFQYMRSPQKFVFKNLQLHGMTTPCEEFIRQCLDPEPDQRHTSHVALDHQWIKLFRSSSSTVDVSTSDNPGYVLPSLCL